MVQNGCLVPFNNEKMPNGRQTRKKKLSEYSFGEIGGQNQNHLTIPTKQQPKKADRKKRCSLCYDFVVVRPAKFNIQEGA